MFTKFYGDTIPAGYILRNVHHDKWFRIHSLPESKRYPETESEWSILISRHIELSNDLMKDEEDILVSWFYAKQIGSLVATSSVKYADDYYDGTFIKSCNTTWPITDFVDMLRLVATDQIRHLTIMSLANGNIYAPYDGGADVFIVEPARYAELKVKYSKYKSLLDSGM